MRHYRDEKRKYFLNKEPTDRLKYNKRLNKKEIKTVAIDEFKVLLIEQQIKI